MIQPKQQVKREGPWPLSALAGCVMMLGMSGCGVTVEPLAQPNLLIAPDELPPWGLDSTLPPHDAFYP